MTMLRRLPLLLLVGALAVGCDDDDDGDADATASGSDGDATDRSAAILALEGDAAAGNTVFSTNSCSVDGCHGADGVSGLASPSLDMSVPNATDEQIVSTFLNGKGGMPSQASLSDEDLANVLAYVTDTFGG